MFLKIATTSPRGQRVNHSKEGILYKLTTRKELTTDAQHQTANIHRNDQIEASQIFFNSMGFCKSEWVSEWLSLTAFLEQQTARSI